MCGAAGLETDRAIPGAAWALAAMVAIGAAASHPSSPYSATSPHPAASLAHFAAPSSIMSAMRLSQEDQERVETQVRRMVAELRATPTAEKEDALGLEVATLPPAERDHVPTVLLRIVAEEAVGGSPGIDWG